MAIKRTDEERRKRELFRQSKKEDLAGRREAGRDELSPGGFIKLFFSLYRFDESEIYNLKNNDKMLEAVVDMKSAIEEKHWDSVIRKSINQTKVAQKDKAYAEMMEYMAF